MIQTSIITSPNQNMTLEKEIRLIKVGILYSDKITLISPQVTMLMSMMNMSNLSEKEKFLLIQQIGPLIDENFDPNSIDFLIEQIKKIKSKRIKESKEIILLRRYKNEVKKMHKSFQDIAKKVYDKSNFEEIEPIIESGKVEFKHFKYELAKPIKEVVQKFITEQIRDTLVNENHYPVFDDLIGSIAHHYSLQEGLKLQKENSKEVEFGKELIFRLPNIDKISFQDILNLKEELNKELYNFKNEILSYSQEISSLPFSNESKIEIKKKYEYVIKPQVIELREKIEKNRFIKILINDSMSNLTKYSAQASVFIGACEYLDYTKLLPLGTLLTQSLYKSIKELKDNNNKFKKHPLFFYHSLSRK